MVLWVKMTCSRLTYITLVSSYQQLTHTRPRVWMTWTIDTAHRVTRTRLASGQEKKKNHEDVSNSSQSLIHPWLLLAVWKKTQHSWSYCKCYCLRVGGRPEIEKDDAWVCKCSTITVCVCICVSERCWFFTLTLWGRPSLPSILPAITL